MMSLRATCFLIVLTTVYLCLELGFNARLLDALGGHVTTSDVHGLETWGRWLSGAAIALLLLQLAIHVRPSMPMSARGAGAYWVLTAALCGASASAVFFSLERLTEHLVQASSGEFRRSALTASLAKAALIDGTTRLGDLGGGEMLADQPEGKAFLALFPLFAGSMDSLEQAFGPDKKPQLQRMIEGGIGGPSVFYAHYREAIQQVHARWRRYDAVDPAALETRLERTIAAEQDKAWTLYLRNLGRRGWSPHTVPYAAQERVRRQLRSRVPVAADWDLGDEDGFRAAVAQKVRKKAGRRLERRAAGTVAPGLGWEAFLAQPAVQRELRRQLKLPAGVVLQPHYATGAQFQRAVFDPLVRARLSERWQAYDASAVQLADGGRFADEGRDAARAVIVPPLALFCSLLGALMHMTKLACMLCYAAMRRPDGSAPQFGRALAAIVALAVAGTVSLAYIDNRFTGSKAYELLENKIASSETNPRWSGLMARALHGVAVGQGLFFPANEFIRTRLLFGLDYGYAPGKHPES